MSDERPPLVPFPTTRDLADQAIRALAEQTAEVAAEKAAMKAVDMAFLHLGIDVTDKAQVAMLRERFEFLRRAERGAREIKSAIVKTCVGSLVLGFLAIIAMGLKDSFVAWLR